MSNYIPNVLFTLYTLTFCKVAPATTFELPVWAWDADCPNLVTGEECLNFTVDAQTPSEPNNCSSEDSYQSWCLPQLSVNFATCAVARFSPALEDMYGYGVDIVWTDEYCSSSRNFICERSMGKILLN